MSTVYRYLRAILVGLGLTCSALAGQPELVFLNWSEYMDPELLRDFEREYRVTVREAYYESDLARTEMLRATGGRGYDVMLVSGADMPNYVKWRWLSKLDAVRVPNLANSDPRWLDAYGGAPRGHGAPYLWGGTGILYRKDKIQEPISHWKQLYLPRTAWKGKVLMLDDPREIIGNALKSMGYSFNSEDSRELRSVERLLLSQKPFVAGYATASLTPQSGFVTGDYWIGMVFNGDALALKDLHPELEFVLPEEGIGLWCDYLAVPARARHKNLAHDFIDFLNRPANAAKLALFTRFASANQAARGLLPVSFESNPMIYPPEDILAKSEMATQHSSRVWRKRTSIYAKVTE